MKYKISKERFNEISKKTDIIDEGLFSAISRIPKAIGKAVPSFIGKTTLKTLTDELNRLLPKQLLTNPKEVSEMVKKLNSLGNNHNLMKPNFIKKYGQVEYDRLLRDFLYAKIDKNTLMSKLKNVKDPNIKLKPIMGIGADHQVFQSVTHPDKIFKLELRPGEIDKWYNIFGGHPDMFPKTYKKVKVKGKNGEILTAAVMEKLNTASFRNLWDEIDSLLQKSQQSLSASDKTSLETLTKRMKQPNYTKRWTDFLTYLKNSGNNSQKINEFITLINKLYEITPNPDIRKFNFGYDKSGVLKSLDI